jgi:hypothetical protein
LSAQAYDELSEMQNILQMIQINDTLLDSRTFCWGNAQYTFAKYYKFIYDAIPEDKALTLVWKSKCLPKLKVFAWLLFLDRLNTKELMHHKS